MTEFVWFGPSPIELRAVRRAGPCLDAARSPTGDAVPQPAGRPLGALADLLEYVQGVVGVDNHYEGHCGHEKIERNCGEVSSDHKKMARRPHIPTPKFPWELEISTAGPSTLWRVVKRRGVFFFSGG